MKSILQGVKRWYLRRFRGYVGPTRDPLSGVPRGTAWQQHPSDTGVFVCQNRQLTGPFKGQVCQLAQTFSEEDYVIREQDHLEDCEWQYETTVQTFDLHHTTTLKSMPVMGKCSCPVTDARYVKLCPQCGLGHWKMAK